MATVIEELVSRLGFEIDDKKLDAFNRKSERLKVNLKRIAIAASAAAAGMATWVSRIGLAVDANIKFADSVDIAFDALQELQFATEREGGSLQSLQQSLLAISQRAGEAFRGIGAGVEIFGLLGISVADVNGELKSSDVLLNDLAKEFQRFGKIQQIDLANKLGISRDLLLLLQKGADNLKDLRLEAREMGLVSEQTARRAGKFQDSLADIRQTVRALFANIAGELLPIITKIAKEQREWVQANKKLISQGVVKFVKIFSKAIEFLLKNTKELKVALLGIASIKIISFFSDLVFTVVSLSQAMLGLNANLAITQFLTGSVVLGLILLAAAALALEDLAVFKSGGDSLFGRLAKDSEDAKENIEKIEKAISFLSSSMEIVEQIIKDAGKGLLDILETLRLIAELNPFSKQNLQVGGDEIILERREKERLRQERGDRSLLDTIRNVLSGLVLLQTPPVPFIEGEIGDFLQQLRDRGRELQLPGFERNPILPPVNENVPANTINNIDAEISINSNGGDPVAIGEAVARAIENIARTGINNQPQVVVV